MFARKLVGLVLVLSCIYTSSAFAETELKASSSVSQTTPTELRFFERLALEYSNTFTGPSLANPFANQNYNDETEDHRGALELENAVLAGYKINPDIILGVVTRWNMHSVPSNGQGFELKDPYLRVSHSKLYSAGNFNIEADFRLSAPVSEQSINHGLVTSMASEQILTYKIPESRFNLKLTTFIQGNFHQGVDSQEGDVYELHFGPGVEYRISESLLTNLIYDASKTQPRFADLSERHQEGSLIETGVIWDITPKIKFNPNLHTRTSRPLTAESFTFGAKLTWAML